ncbi:hypothetical protein [Halobacterium wangiae]|uniref:hypothetical protein n=1 Tax=Halobacterium wangiae TaxID=2902623 RepID=UPI001E2BADAC|nr:hypothetical protein [Halobacterium wangiae]
MQPRTAALAAVAGGAGATRLGVETAAVLARDVPESGVAVLELRERVLDVPERGDSVHQIERRWSLFGW